MIIELIKHVSGDIIVYLGRVSGRTKERKL